MSGLDEVSAERRRLDAVGFEAAAEVELLGVVLRSEAKARAVLQDLGGLVAVQRASLQRLQRVPGLGRAGAATIRAAFELGRRAMILDAPFGRKISDASYVAEFLRASIGAADQETLLVLGLDQHLRLQVVRTVGTGSPTKVVIHPREVRRRVPRRPNAARRPQDRRPKGRGGHRVGDEAQRRDLGRPGPRAHRRSNQGGRPAAVDGCRRARKLERPGQDLRRAGP